MKDAFDACQESNEQIIRRCFPAPILKELEVLSQYNGPPEKVFVVKNMPEIEGKDIPERLRHINQQNSLDQWLFEHSYASRISAGIAAAFNMNQTDHYPLLRYDGSDVYTGKGMHQHSEPVTSFSIIEADGAKTRFTDFKTLTEDSDAEHINIAFEHRREEPVHTMLGALKEMYDKFRHGKAHISSIMNDRAAFENVVNKHSQIIVAERGDMVLWANKGRVWHEALPSPPQGKQGFLTRAGINFEYWHR